LTIEKIICLKAKDKFLFFEERDWPAFSCPSILIFPASLDATCRLPKKKARPQLKTG